MSAMLQLFRLAILAALFPAGAWVARAQAVHPAAPAGKPLSGGITYVRPFARTIVPLVGLNVHTRDTPRELPVIVRSGADAIRFHYTWKEVEREKGKFQLPPTAYAFLTQIRQAGLSPLLILAYGNPLYDRPGSKPGFGEHAGQSQEFADAFGRYCAWMVKTFGARGTGQVSRWEVWNEQNEAPAEDYLRVLRAASQAIRANDPDAVIVFGGISRMDYAFLQKCLELGAAPLVDAVAIHPYRESVFPEQTFQSERRFGGATRCYADEVLKVQQLLDRHAVGGRRLPLWITEFGYWTTDAEPQLDRQACVSHDVQAKYLLRSMIQNFALGIDQYYIYRAVDSSFFGLTYGPEFLPRPAYFALQHLLAQIPQKSPVKVLDAEVRVELTPAARRAVDALFQRFDPHVYLFQTAPGTALLVYWNAGPGRELYNEGSLPTADLLLPFAVTDREVLGYDLFYGSTQRAYAQDGGLASPVTAAAGGSRIRKVKYYDGPVMFKLTLGGGHATSGP